MLSQVIQNDNIDHNPQLDEIIFFFFSVFPFVKPSLNIS